MSEYKLIHDGIHFEDGEITTNIIASQDNLLVRVQMTRQAITKGVDNTTVQVYFWHPNKYWVEFLPKFQVATKSLTGDFVKEQVHKVVEANKP